MKPAGRSRVSIRMTTRTRTPIDMQTDTLQSAPAPAATAEAPIPPGLPALAHMDRRGWMALAGIAVAGAAIGAGMGAELHETVMFGWVVGAMIVVSAGRAAWGWLRGGGRRARLAEGALAKIEAHGGGFYGTGAAITLLILSAASLREEWAAAGGAWNFVRRMTPEFWIGFSGDSIGNAVQAGMWPIHWFANHGLAAALVVAAAAWVGDAMADAWRRSRAGGTEAA